MIKLQPFTLDDAEVLISKITDERMLLQFAGPMYQFPLTADQLEEDLHDPNRTLFRIVEQTDRTVIGHAQIF